MIESPDTIFTHRDIRPSVRPELEVESGMRITVARKQNQLDVVNTRTLYDITERRGNK